MQIQCTIKILQSILKYSILNELQQHTALSCVLSAGTLASVERVKGRERDL